MTSQSVTSVLHILSLQYWANAG